MLQMALTDPAWQTFNPEQQPLATLNTIISAATHMQMQGLSGPVRTHANAMPYCQ